MTTNDSGCTRRVFLNVSYVLLGTGLFSPAACVGGKNDTPVRVSGRNNVPIPQPYRLPDTPFPIDIDSIVEGLSSGKTIGEVNIVPSLFNLLQHTHIARTGRTYQADIEARLQNSNPIYILIVKDLIQDYGRSYFEFDNNRQGVHLCSLDASLLPPEALNAASHEMGHSYNPKRDGEMGEMVPVSRALLDISHIVAHHPQVLREIDSQCPLTQIMEEYMDVFALPQGHLSSQLVGAIRLYLSFLSISDAELWNRIPGQSIMEKVAGFLERPDSAFLVEINEHQEKLLQYQVAEQIKLAAYHLTKVTEEYILQHYGKYVLQQNRDFPKRELLTKKLGAIRTSP